MLRYVLLAVIGLVGIFTLGRSSAAPIPAAKDAPVELPVPASSMVVVQLNGIEKTRDRLAKLSAAAAPDVAETSAKKIDEFLERLFDGRDWKVISPEARVYAAIDNFNGLTQFSEAKVAAFIPVKDYKAFRKGFLKKDKEPWTQGKDGVDSFEMENDGGKMYIVPKEGVLAFATNEEYANKLAGKFDPLTVKRIGSVSEAFLTADVGIYVNMSRINDEYGQQLQQFRQLINLGIQQGGMGIDKHQLDAGKALIEGLFQAIEDGRGLAIGLSLPPSGVALRVDMQFAADTASAKLIAAEKVSPLARLGELPAGFSSYSAWSTSPGLTGEFAKLTAEFQPAENDDSATDAIKAFTRLMNRNNVESVSASGSDASAITITTLSNPDAAKTALLKVLKSLPAGASFSNVILKNKPKIADDEKKHAGFSFHEARIELDFEATAAKIANEDLRETTIESMKKLTPEKQTMWFGSDGKRFVRVSAKDWPTAKKLIDGLSAAKADQVGGTAAFAKVRGELPANTAAITIIEVASFVSNSSEYLAGMAGQVPGFPAELPKFKKPAGVDPAFLGISYTAQVDTLRTDLFFPVGGFNVIRKSLDESK